MGRCSSAGTPTPCPSRRGSSALEVLAANDVTVLVDSADRFTPTPAVSHAILRANGGRIDRRRPGRRHRRHAVAQPAARRRLQVQPAARRAGRHRCHRLDRQAGQRALAAGLAGVAPGAVRPARAAAQPYDFLATYVDDLPNVVDIDAIRRAGVRIGADPLGGASVDYWAAIAERHGLDLTVVNPLVDPTLRFMTLDWDGRIRMDCSSADAMASLIARRDEFQIATGNDADADRHGIVTPDGGLLNPNHFLAVAIAYLYADRDGWSPDAAIGKTLVSSSMIDRVAADWAAASTRCRSASSGSCPGCSTGRSGSAARSRPAPRSSAATARCGPPTRTGSCWPCWRRRSRPRPGARRRRTTPS